MLDWTLLMKSISTGTREWWQWMSSALCGPSLQVTGRAAWWVRCSSHWYWVGGKPGEGRDCDHQGACGGGEEFDGHYSAVQADGAIWFPIFCLQRAR